MKHFKALVWSALLVCAVGCGSAPSGSVVGKWEASTDMLHVDLEFGPDGSMTSTSTVKRSRGKAVLKTHATYKVREESIEVTTNKIDIIEAPEIEKLTLAAGNQAAEGTVALVPFRVEGNKLMYGPLLNQGRNPLTFTRVK